MILASSSSNCLLGTVLVSNLPPQGEVQGHPSVIYVARLMYSYVIYKIYIDSSKSFWSSGHPPLSRLNLGDGDAAKRMYSCQEDPQFF